MATPRRTYGTRSNSRDLTPSQNQAPANPGRRLPARKNAAATAMKNERELPSLAGKVSNAYGGSGRAALPEHMDVVTEDQDLGDLLNAKRILADSNIERQQSDSADLDNEAVNDAPTQARSRRQSASPSATSSFSGTAAHANRRDAFRGAQPPIIEEEEDVEDVVDSTEAHGDDTTQFETSRTFTKEAHVSRGALDASVDSTSAAADHVSNGIVASRPIGQNRAALMVASRTLLLLSLKVLLYALLGVLAIYGTAQMMRFTNIQPDSLAFENRSPLGGRLDYLRWKTWELFNTTRANLRGDEFKYDYRFEQDKIESQQRNNTERLNHIMSVLPETLVFPRNEATGMITIPDTFWNALIAKSSFELGFSKDQTIWRQFLLNNEEQLQEIIELKSKAVVNETLGPNGLLTAVDVVRMIKRNNQHMMDQIRMAADEVERRYQTQYSAFVKNDLNRIVDDRFRDAPWEEMLAVSRHFHVQNQVMAYKTIDWFHANIGTAINFRYTSPALVDERLGPLQRFAGYFDRLINVATQSVWQPNAPATVLAAWEGPGDCWCAAPSNLYFDKKKKAVVQKDYKSDPVHAKAQVTMIIPQLVVPQSFTIDHIPKSGTLDPLSTPREVELWIEIPDYTTRRLIYEAQLAYRMTPPPGKTVFDDAKHAGLPDSFVQIGSFEYDINAENHVQTFTLPLDLVGRWGVEAITNHATVRVLSSWGADYVCLFKIRMNGKAKQQFLDRSKIRQTLADEGINLGDWFVQQ